MDESEYAAWFWSRFDAAFALEIKPRLLQIMREHFERTGAVDDPRAVTWEDNDPFRGALIFEMDSGARHRIAFTLAGTEQ